MLALRTILAAAALLAFASSAAGRADDRRLVLIVVVDQLRGDFPLSYEDRFGRGGFRRLLDRGVWFTNAHFRHSTTFTAAGHATIATGAGPNRHGIVGNSWHDPRTGAAVYSAGDARHRPLLDAPPESATGTSPANLLASSVGDELVLATSSRSRVFAVSLKDRAAILSAGRLGDAYWYDKASGRFITSTYYHEEYPQWVVDFDAQRHADRLVGTSWYLLAPSASYRHADDTSRRHSKRPDSSFPHRLGDTPSAVYSRLRETPMGDVLTLEFVKRLIDHERVGRGESADVLTVSFSATDYIGHAFGPYSLEYEDNLLHLDRTLRELLDFVDDRVGLDRTLVCLTADHGIDAIPGHRSEVTGLGHGDHASTGGDDVFECGVAGNHDSDDLREGLNGDLRERFPRLDRDVVFAYTMPCFYFNHAVIAAADLDAREVEEVAATWLRAQPGSYRVYTRAELESGAVRSGDDHLDAMVRRSFHPARSGDLLLISQPSWFVHPTPQSYPAMHGSPWRYDTHVPVVFMASGVAPARVERSVGPEDIAPTVAAWLRITPPPSADGEALPEVTVRR